MRPAKWFACLAERLGLGKKPSRSPAIDIYTDGSQKSGWGSWAFIIVQDGMIKMEESGRVRKACSTKMEYQAAIQALRILPDSSHVRLSSDSRILVDSVASSSAQMSINKPKAFLNSIFALEQAASRHHVEWRWVKAHSGNPFNERCDYLCRVARTVAFQNVSK